MDWTGGIEIGASELLSSDCPMGGAKPRPELGGNNIDLIKWKALLHREKKRSYECNGLTVPAAEKSEVRF